MSVPIRTFAPHLLAMAALILACASPRADDTRPLPALNIDIHETSVSGLSSGAFMAVQFQVAHASIIKGSGIIAGGPYYCAQDNVLTATTHCSCTLDASHQLCSVNAESADVSTLVQATQDFARRSLIDDPRHLARQRSLLLAGGKDHTVPKVIVGQLQDYLLAMGMPHENLSAIDLPNAGHALPTKSYGSTCSITDEPYINNCDFDAAGRILNWIYGPLQPARSGARQGQFIRFDQRPYRHGIFSGWLSGLDNDGWLYVPETCARGEACRLHVALHGCRQGQGYMPLHWSGPARFGTTFVENAGYDAWADTNHIVVLYPQAVSVMMRNPNGCWDWWGYTDSHYADKQGVQIRALRAMIDDLTKGHGHR